MERVITLLKKTPYLEIHDIVTNAGKLATPVMMMYHINFGEPFLSERLQVSADFTYIEERDTKRCSPPDEVLAMAKRGECSEGDGLLHSDRPAKGSFPGIRCLVCAFICVQRENG